MITTIITLLTLVGLYSISRKVTESDALVFSNVSTGTHANGVTRIADSAIVESYCLVEIGSTSEHVAICDNSGDIPLGIATDEAEASGDPIAIALLGSACETMKVRTGANVAAGAFLITNNSGKAISLPGSAGSYYIIGRALHPANSGELVEFDPCLPTLRVVS